jgi:hypothetical protein
LKAEKERQAASEEVIREFFLQLEGADRDEIMRLPPIEARQRLSDKYNETHKRHLTEMGERLMRLRNRLGLPGRLPAGLPPLKDGAGRNPQAREPLPFLPGKKRSDAERPFPGLSPERTPLGPRRESPSSQESKKNE